MENSEIIVGLDIGTTKICAMVGRKNEFGKIEILGSSRLARALRSPALRPNSGTITL